MTELSQIPPEDPEYDVADIDAVDDPGEPDEHTITDDYDTEA